MKKIGALIVFLVFLPSLVSALNFDLGIEENISGYFYEEEDNFLEKEEEKDCYWKSEMIIPARLSAENWKLLLEPKILVDSEGISQGGESTRDSRRAVVGVREAYLTFLQQKLKVCAGYQIADWSITDMVSPSDNLNPLDLTLIPDWKRRSVPLVTARYGYDTYLEVAYKPFFSPSFLPRYKWEKKETGIRFLQQKGEEDKAQFAFRVGGILWDMDWQLSYYKGYTYSPYGEIENLPVLLSKTKIKPEVRPRYSEQQVGSIGLTADTIAGILIRTEAGYFSQDHGDNFYQYVVGMEKNWQNVASFGDKFSFLVQFCDEEIVEKDKEIMPLIDFRRIFRDSFLIRSHYRFGRGSHWKIKIRGSYDLKNYDSFWEPALEWEGDHFSCKLGIQIVDGPEKTFWGEYRDNDCIFFKSKIKF